MKNFTRVLLATLAMLAIALPSSAQFRWGIRAGVNVNSIHFSQEDYKQTFDSENRAGFTGGLTTEFTVPIVGIGFDASLMYVHRNNNMEVAANNSGVNTNLGTTNSDYLEIPINLKYKLGLPVVGNIVTPYIATGPSFAFLCSKSAISDAYKHKTMDVSWNVGVGVELVNHLQIGASYGFGVTKAFEYVGLGNQPADLGKANCWTISAAYFF